LKISGERISAANNNPGFPKNTSLITDFLCNTYNSGRPAGKILELFFIMQGILCSQFISDGTLVNKERQNEVLCYLKAVWPMYQSMGSQ
jgi:hypothetical protein